MSDSSPFLSLRERLGTQVRWASPRAWTPGARQAVLSVIVAVLVVLPGCAADHAVENPDRGRVRDLRAAYGGWRRARLSDRPVPDGRSLNADLADLDTAQVRYVFGPPDSAVLNNDTLDMRGGRRFVPGVVPVWTYYTDGIFDRGVLVDSLDYCYVSILFLSDETASQEVCT